MKISIHELVAFTAFTLLGCSQPAPNPTPQPGPIDYGIVMRLRDLTTNYPAMPRESDEAPLTFTFQGGYPNMELADFERTQLAAWQRSIRVVTWPEREMVPGHWEVLTEPWRIAFVQDAPFAERWYAWQINLATLPASLGIWHDTRPEDGAAGHALVDGWVTSRFRIGSAAVVVVGGLWDRGSGTVGLGATEPVVSRTSHLASEVLSVTAAGRPLRCEPPVDEFPAGTPIEGTWSCVGDVAATDTIRVSLLVNDLATRSGMRAQVCGEGNPPTWVSRPGIPGDYQARLPGQFCADSAFLPPVAEGL